MGLSQQGLVTTPCSQILVFAAQYPNAFIINVEVVQGLLHHYRRHRPIGRAAVQDLLLLMTGHLADIEPPDVSAVLALADQYPQLSARALLHVAVIQRLGVPGIATADADAGHVPALVRLDPAHPATWRHIIVSRGAGTS